MRFLSFALSVLALLCAASSGKTQVADFDPRAATSNLARSVTEDYQRERSRQIRQEEEDAHALDFSASAMPADSGKAPASEGGITCTTIGLSDGYSITTCP